VQLVGGLAKSVTENKQQKGWRCGSLPLVMHIPFPSKIFGFEAKHNKTDQTNLKPSKSITHSIFFI